MPDLRKRVHPVCVHKMQHSNGSAIPHSQCSKYVEGSHIMNGLPRHKVGFYSFVGVALVAAVVLTIF